MHPYKSLVTYPNKSSCIARSFSEESDPTNLPKIPFLPGISEDDQDTLLHHRPNPHIVGAGVVIVIRSRIHFESLISPLGWVPGVPNRLRRWWWCPGTQKSPFINNLPRSNWVMVRRRMKVRLSFWSGLVGPKALSLSSSLQCRENSWFRKD